MVHVVPHAIELGMSPTTAASILAIIGGASIVGRVVLGTAGDRIGNKRVLIISFAFTSIALFLLVTATDLWLLYLFAVIFGGFAFGTAAIQSPLVAGLFGLSSFGVIYGMTGLSFTIGGAIGPFVAGYIFDVSNSYQLAFTTSAAIVILSIILTAFLKQTKMG